MSLPITLYTETAVDSCHRLNGYDGKCRNWHGHTWLISLWIQGDDSQKNDVGILFDFGTIKEIHELLDHKEINSVILDKEGKLNNPTAENISKFILLYLKEKCPTLEFRVRVYETAVLKKTYAQVQTKDFRGDLI